MLSSSYSVWSTLRISSHTLLAAHITDSATSDISHKFPPSFKDLERTCCRDLGEWMEMVLFCLGGWFCLFIIIIYIIVLCVGTHAMTRAAVREHLWESVLSFQHVDSRTQTQVIGMGKCLFPLSRLARHSGCFGCGGLSGVQIRASVAKRIWREGFLTTWKSLQWPQTITNFMGTCRY